jgi:hypothetical protein
LKSDKMDAPFVILLELFVGLIRGIIDTLAFMVSKLIELFISLGVIAGASPLGFIVAVAVGTAIILLIMKFVLGSSRSYILIGAVAAVLFIIAILIGSM